MSTKHIQVTRDRGLGNHRNQFSMRRTVTATSKVARSALSSTSAGAYF